MSFPSYTTGTISIGAGATTAVGTGAIWSGVNARAGDLLLVGSTLTLVKDVIDVTHLAIPAWPGSAQTNVAYTLFQTSPLRFVGGQAMADVSALIAGLNTNTWIVNVPAGATAPDPSYGTELQYAFQIATGTWWQKLSAVWQVSLSPNQNDQPLFVFEGDSLTDVASGISTWPTLLKKNHAFFSRGSQVNYALAGDRASLMVGEFASQAGSLNVASGREAYFFLWAGTNDISQNDSAATIYGNLKSIWSAARAKNFKVVAFTVMVRGDESDAQNDVRLALNALILSDRTLFDYLVRPDAVFLNCYDLDTFQPDLTHLRAKGDQIISDLVSASVLNVAPPISVSVSTISAGGLQINGDFNISQINGSASVSSIGTVVDGCMVFQSGIPGFVAGRSPNGPPGFLSSIYCGITAAKPTLAAGDFLFIEMPIEGYRASKLNFGSRAAQPISIGFWTAHNRTGLHSGVVHNASYDRSYIFTYTQEFAGNWEYKTVTLTGSADATGGAGGVWDKTNGRGLVVVFSVAAGSTYTGTPNVWLPNTYVGTTGTANGATTTGDVFRLGGVNVHPGIYLPTAHQSTTVFRPYDQELRTCQRYYNRYDVSPYQRLFTAIADTASSVNAIMSLPTNLATPRSVSINNITLNGNAISSIALTGLANNYASLSIASSSLIVQKTYEAYSTGTGSLTFDSQL